MRTVTLCPYDPFGVTCVTFPRFGNASNGKRVLARQVTSPAVDLFFELRGKEHAARVYAYLPGRPASPRHLPERTRS